MTTKKTMSARKLLKGVFRSSFGEFVRDIRECDEISQAELAKRMRVSRQFIHAVEKDKATISLEMAIKIASALGYPYEAFVEIFLNDMLRKSGIKKMVHLVSKAA
ncbi:MAG TPA: helix-turn-helix transcriptional regulator [Gammaproteobacteria bacterium]|nr:helix-turn-helix transcriptional regulator [Gammaproteobacteria bacterium]